MDMFVFPSTVEAFGYSLIEAMLMAKPVLVSDIPSFRVFITVKPTGYSSGALTAKASLTPLSISLKIPINGRPLAIKPERQ